MTSASRSTIAHDGEPSGSLLDTIIECLDDAKGENIVTIDLEGKTSIADAMVVASGRSKRHVSAIASRLIKLLKEQGHKGLKSRAKALANGFCWMWEMSLFMFFSPKSANSTISKKCGRQNALTCSPSDRRVIWVAPQPAFSSIWTDLHGYNHSGGWPS